MGVEIEFASERYLLNRPLLISRSGTTDQEMTFAHLPQREVSDRFSIAAFFA